MDSQRRAPSRRREVYRVASQVLGERSVTARPAPTGRIRIWYSPDRGYWLARVPILAGVVFQAFATLPEAVTWAHQS